MSIPRQMTVVCPHCKTSYVTMAWKTLDSGLSPDLTKNITAGRFFNSTCPYCNRVSQLEYDFRYTDSVHKAIIQVIHPSADYKSKLDSVRASAVPQGYMTRVVTSNADFQEKVAILEAGRDDRVIELMKQLTYRNYSKNNPRLKKDAIYYTRYEKDEHLILFDSNGASYKFDIADKEYRNTNLLFKQLLGQEQSNFVVIDYNWAGKAVSDYYQTAEINAQKQGCTVDHIVELDIQRREFEELQNRSRAAHSGGAANGSGSNAFRYCPRCGSKVSASAAYCHICGVVLPDSKGISTPRTNPAQDTPEPAAASPEPSKSKFDRIKDRFSKKWSFPLLIALLIIGFFMLPHIFNQKPDADVILNESNYLTIRAGQTHAILYTADPQSALSRVEWTVSNPSIAKVSSVGLITAVSSGTATIEAKLYGETKETIHLTVLAREETSTAAGSKPSQPYHNSTTLTPVPIDNGEMIIYPRYYDDFKITVNASFTENCYVYCLNHDYSYNSFSFYVEKGQSTTMKVPSGTYSVYFAEGEIWYGKEELFGDNTAISMDSENLTLARVKDGLSSITYTLYSVPSGNFVPKTITRDQFPG